MRTVSLLLLLLLLAIPARASSPEDTVRAFYQAYLVSLEKTPAHWVESLLAAQQDSIEPALSGPLLKLSQGDPNKGEDFLDFDPFSNSQIGVDTYTVQSSSMKGGLAYVPVAMRLSHQSGAEKVRLRFVLRPHGPDWQIANILYPAEAGAPAWDLKSYLQHAGT